jgi:hypothetical protein
VKQLNLRSRHALAVVGLALVVIVLLVPTALAFDGRGGDIVVIDADEVIDDDLYVGANEFTLNGTVKGDLFVGGTTITINGTVEGDLFATGQSVAIKGKVGDDVRIAGWALTVAGDVADDLIAFGFSLETERESKVGGDLLSFGYQALLAGDVAGDAIVNGNAVVVEGRVGGDLTVDVANAQQGQRMPPGFPFAPNLPPVPSVSSGLALASSASIGGDLNYTALAEVSIPPGVVAGQTSFTEYVPPEGEAVPRPTLMDRVGSWFGRQVRRLITLLIIGSLMMWLIPAWTHQTAHIVRDEPLPSLGWGVVAAAVFVVAIALMACVTTILFVLFRVLTLRQLARLLAVGGLLDMAIVAYVFAVIWGYVTPIIIGVLFGQLIFGLFKSKASEHRWWPMVLGVFVYVAIRSIPILGWLLGLIAALFGLGAIWIWARDWWRDRKGARGTAGTTTPDAPEEEPGQVVEAKAPDEPSDAAGDVPPPDAPGPTA